MVPIRVAQSWLSGETAAVKETIHENGFMSSFLFVADDNTNNVTFTLKILDNEDKELYSKASLAENTSTFTGSLSVPVDRGYKVQVTPSGDPGTSGANTWAKLFIEKK